MMSCALALYQQVYMHTKAVPKTIDYRTIEGGELTLTSQTPLTQKNYLARLGRTI